VPIIPSSHLASEHRRWRKVVEILALKGYLGIQPETHQGIFKS
jgi:hypothetical protein